MSRHEKDLEDMHDLLQQMKDMHGEYNVPEYCEGMLTNLYQSAKKKYGTTFRKETVKKITDMFKKKTEDEQKSALEAYIESTSNNNDVFSVFTSMISIDALMNIIENLDVNAKRSDSAMHAKMKKDPRVQTAKDRFEKFDPGNQKKDLKEILTQIYTEGKTTIMVLDGLLEMSNLQSEIKTKWNVQ